MNIPFNKPYLTGNELNYIKDILNDASHLSGDGKYTKKVHEFIEKNFGTHKALLTTSGTSALELATHLLNLKPNDEVIVPSYTFSSTVNPILLAGAKPVFADITEDTLNIDPEEIKKKITSKTKAIYPVHYGGVACDMDKIMEIASNHSLYVVEDAAQGVNAKYKNRYLGTIGDFGCYSFHETKNYVCGEGGALLINVNDKKIIERAEILREKGTNRKMFNRGEVDKYTWVDVGSSYLPSDILAAFLYAQLENADDINEKRMKIWNAYYNALKSFQTEGKIQLPTMLDYAEHNAHLFYIIFQNEKIRNQIMKQLKDKGISAVFHYVPLHTSPVGIKLGYTEGELQITESVSNRLLRLPLYANMKNDELNYIKDILISALKFI